MTVESGTGQQGLNHWESDGKDDDCFSDREAGVKDKAHEVGLYKQENRTNIRPKDLLEELESSTCLKMLQYEETVFSSGVI
jgi:hypothetical protein